MEDSKRTLVISTMKDEAPYILEWLAYHRAIGFTDFLIYTNDCSDGTDLLLDRLQTNGIVVHERNNVLRRGPHKSALKFALEHEAFLSAHWVYVCDVDEFLNIKIGNGLVDDLVAHYFDADVIPVAWRLFSNNQHETLFPGLCTESFTDAESVSSEAYTEGKFVKSLFKPSASLTRLGLHGPIYNEDSARAAKWASAWLTAEPKSDPMRPKKDFGYEIAQINHYAVRSIDAFLIKCDRGRANHTKETLGSRYWKRWNRGGEQDLSIQRHCEAMWNELRNLREDPIVACLHDGAVEYHKKKLQSLLRKSEFRELREELMALSSWDGAPKKVSASFQTKETRDLKIKAPNRHKNRLQLLKAMPQNGRCAEIGVWNGGFSGAILEETAPQELILIDPWDLLSGQEKDEWTHHKHQDHQEMRRMFENVKSNYEHLPNVQIRRGFSAEVLSSFPDCYFDWIYIDGNHLYEFVRKDLELGFRKVKPGGIIAGDDFFWKRGGRMHVRDAVLDEMRAQGMKNRPKRFGQQYMIKVTG